MKTGREDNASVRHAFVVCAYKQSPFLRECLDSLLAQEECDSEILIATSTPSVWLSSLAGEYGLPVYFNDGDPGIGNDWNFAVSKATARYITVAHQDDIYLPRYAATSVKMLDRSSSSILFFCNYGEIRNGERVDENRILATKRRMLRVLRNGKNANNIHIRRRILSLGSPVCCPSVTFNMGMCPARPFQTRMRCSLDWDTWESLSRLSGGFYYSDEILMYHRIYGESTTSQLIENNTRGDEDFEMFRRFWPRPVALALGHLYARSEKSNDLS